MNSIWRHVRPLLGIVISGLFIWLILRRVQLGDVTAVLSRMSLVNLLIALSFLAADYILRIIRWWLMLRALDRRVSLAACIWPFLVSISVNNLLPFRAGDALRVAGFRKQLDAPAMRVLGTLVIERLLDLMTLLFFFFVGLPYVADNNIASSLMRFTFWIAVAGFVSVFSTLVFLQRIEQFVYFVADRDVVAKRGWSDLIKRHCTHFFEAFRLLLSPSLTIQLIAISAAVWSFEGAVFAAAAQALNLETATGVPWFAMASGTLATLLPSSPGYIGTFDYFVIWGLMVRGAHQAAATAFAVAVHSILWFPLTSAGAIYLMVAGVGILRRRAFSVFCVKKDLSI
jgi:glycosyltransferase 2 family protein